MSEQAELEAPARVASGRLILVRKWLPIILIAAVSVFAFSKGWHSYLSIDALAANQEWLRRFIEDNLILSGGAYLLLYIVLVALSFPGASLVTITGGFLFGWLAAGTMTAIGATLGASVIFLAAKTSFGAALRKRAGPMLEKFAEGFEKNAFSYLLSLRLLPVFPFWLVNLAPSLFNVPLKTYMSATFIGILPGTYAYSFLGSGLGSVIEAQMQQSGATSACLSDGSCTISIDIGALVTTELVAAFAALGLVALIPVAVRRFRSGSTPND